MGLAWVQHRQTYCIVRILIYNNIKFCTVLSTLFHLYTVLNEQYIYFFFKEQFLLHKIIEQSIYH